MRKNPLNLLPLAGLVAMLPVAGAMAQERPSFYDPRFCSRHHVA